MKKDTVTIFLKATWSLMDLSHVPEKFLLQLGPDVELLRHWTVIQPLSLSCPVSAT